jgi:N-acetylmuramoyl-L-alanine amidase CwlA
MKMSYTIKRNIIPGLPQLNYRNGVGCYEGVVSHCTESQNHIGGDTPTGERNYEAGSYNTAFVHYFVGVENGQAVIEQVADTKYGAYGAGPSANHRFVHVELCMYDDPKLFNIAYNAYVYILAKTLFDRKLGVTRAQANGTGTLWAHSEVTKYLGGTTHQDPDAYFAQHGLTLEKHYENVLYAYNQLATPPAPVAPVAPVKHQVKIVNVKAACILMDKADRDNGKEIDTIPLGTVVNLVSPVEGVNNQGVGYFKVAYNGKVGYINAKFGQKL